MALLLPLWVKSERLRGLQWVGLCCAFVAVAFALREGFANGLSSSARGDLLGLAAGMFWGLSTVVIRATGLSGSSAEKLLFYQLEFGAVACPAVSLALGEIWDWHFSSFAVTSLLLQTLVGAFASYLAWMWLLGHYHATQMTTFVFFTPLFALLPGTLWLRETITPGLLATVALGIMLVNRKPSGPSTQSG